MYQNLIIFTIFFNQINAVLVIVRHFYQKHLKISYRPQTYEQLVYVIVSAKLTLYEI